MCWCAECVYETHCRCASIRARTVNANGSTWLTGDGVRVEVPGRLCHIEYPWDEPLHPVRQLTGHGKTWWQRWGFEVRNAELLVLLLLTAMLDLKSWNSDEGNRWGMITHYVLLRKAQDTFKGVSTCPLHQRTQAKEHTITNYAFRDKTRLERNEAVYFPSLTCQREARWRAIQIDGQKDEWI